MTSPESGERVVFVKLIDDLELPGPSPIGPLWDIGWTAALGNLRERLAALSEPQATVPTRSAGNVPSDVRVFVVMAERVRAGEPWREVLTDYGFSGPPPPGRRAALEKLEQLIMDVCELKRDPDLDTKGEWTTAWNAMVGLAKDLAAAVERIIPDAPPAVEREQDGRAALEWAKGEVADLVTRYLRENRHLEPTVTDIMAVFATVEREPGAGEQDHQTKKGSQP